VGSIIAVSLSLRSILAMAPNFLVIVADDLASLTSAALGPRFGRQILMHWVGVALGLRTFTRLLPALRLDPC